MHAYILLALVASATASFFYTPAFSSGIPNYFGASNYACPNVRVVNNFQLSKFGNGKWYEVARYYNPAEQGGDCSTAEYRLEGDIIKIRNSDVAGNKLRTIEGFAKMARDAGDAGILVNTLPYGPNRSYNDYTLYILDVDYDNYAVGYYCKYSADGLSRQDFAWVLSRTKTLTPYSQAAVQRVIRESNLLDASKFIYPDFSDAACRLRKY